MYKMLKNSGINVLQNSDNSISFSYRSGDQRFDVTYRIFDSKDIHKTIKMEYDRWNKGGIYKKTLYMTTQEIEKVVNGVVAQLPKFGDVNADSNTEIYRVMQDPEDLDYWDIPVPGSGTNYTGFWTPDLKLAYAIIRDRDSVMAQIDGGYSRAMIVSTTLDNVQIDNELGIQKKDGYSREYDINEYFVKKILDEKKIKKVI